jgi:hypothetical protein
MAVIVEGEGAAVFEAVMSQPVLSDQRQRQRDFLATMHRQH